MKLPAGWRAFLSLRGLKGCFFMDQGTGYRVSEVQLHMLELFIWQVVLRRMQWKFTETTVQVLLYSYSKGDDPHQEPYATTPSPGLIAEEQRAQKQNRLGGCLGRRPTQDAAGGQCAPGPASGPQGGTGFFLRRRLGLTTFAARCLLPAFHPTPSDLPPEPV